MPRRSRSIAALGVGCCLLLELSGATGCHFSAALRRSGDALRSGFDVESHGPWVLVTGPGSLAVAAGHVLVGGFVPETGPRAEPPEKWFRSYAGAVLPIEAVAVLCHREPATLVLRLRREDGHWIAARHQKWHFPVCLEVLPGRYELEVAYFVRETDEDREGSVTRQAESTEPSRARWQAEAGRLYLLAAVVGAPAPHAGPAPRRHIPHSRSLDTTWWELQESEWSVRIDPVAWEEIDRPVLAHRSAWLAYERTLR